MKCLFKILYFTTFFFYLISLKLTLRTQNKLIEKLNSLRVKSGVVYIQILRYLSETAVHSDSLEITGIINSKAAHSSYII